MNELDGGRSTRAWNYYPSPDIPVQIESPWKNIGPAASINAISFGFVATAILISMFLIMAIIEHLFRPTNDPSHPTLPSPNGVLHGSSFDSRSSQKSINHHNMVRTTNPKEYSVIMPGQKYPTCIAQPAPLLPSPREGFHWNSHHGSFAC